MLRRVGYGRVVAVDRLSIIGRYNFAIAFDECRECTQPVVDSQLDHGTDNETRPDADSITPWGRLTPTYTLSSSFATHEFVPRSSSMCQVSDKDSLELDIYTIGRNHKCDVVIDDSRVSGCHCRIFRSWETRPGLASRLLPYIEDLSSNGTFINRNKLKRRERRLLCSGDELTFLSPKIPEARFTAHVYINMSCRGSSLAPQHETSHRSLTLGALSSDRHLENDYQLCEELGSGTIGKVYRAVERSTGKAFAAKIIPTRKFAFQRSFSANDLLQEARMLRNLHHPGIVSVRDAYNETTSFAIVMQLVEGGDLFDRVVKRGRYPESDARDTMTNLLSALAYLHMRGIAHRDIKPENILLRSKDSDVDVLITDFGLAKGAAVGSQGCRTFCGTPQYLAPEVMERHTKDNGKISAGYDGAAADIWSVGIVLFVLLSGTQPVNSSLEFKHYACTFDDDIWQCISAEAKYIILQLTLADPCQRPTAASAPMMSWFSGSRSCLRHDSDTSPAAKRTKH